MTAAGPMPSQPAKKTNTVLIVVIVVAAVGFVGVFLVGVMAAFGVAGFRKYLAASKQSEATVSVMQLAHGMLACAEKRTAEGLPPLPPSSKPVPDSLSKVSGKKYMSSSTDWEQDAFQCASFSLSYPQYFQYQWVLEAGGRTGTAQASADLDGDGSAELRVEMQVTCDSGGTCSTAPLREIRR